jgi:hypothetical protein
MKKAENHDWTAAIEAIAHVVSDPMQREVVKIEARKHLERAAAQRIVQESSGAVENTREIVTFFGCARCVFEKPSEVAPRDWMRFEVGWTPRGLQVWCVRHDINVIHMDFEGHKHPANTTTWAKR